MANGTLFGIELYEDSTPAEIQHQMDKLRRNEMWNEAVGDTMHPSNKAALAAMNRLCEVKQQVLDAERFQAAALPPDTDPADAKALLDKYMADPKFRCAYRDEDHLEHGRIAEIAEQLVTWAQAPPPGEGGQDQADTVDGLLGDGSDNPPAAANGGGRQTVAGRLADKDFRAAYLNADHPEHAGAVAEMTALHQTAAPAASEGGQ